jgi:ABC-type multidrug transport system ATPase subunit
VVGREIIISGISRSYDEVDALRNISLEVDKGELFGFIGPDGAGKTTLFRILVTLLLPDKGRAWVSGFDVVKQYRKIRRISGYMPGRFSLYQDLTVEENLKFFASIFKASIAENYDLIKDIYRQIEPFKDRPAGKLSGGMKQKLALSCALVHRPEVLFLDEPTTGVDAVSRKEFWDMLGRLKDKGITILVSTPYMDEASRCDRVALMQKGRVLDINTPGGIISKYPHPLAGITSSNMRTLVNDLRSDKEISSAFRFGDNIHCAGAGEEIDIGGLKERLEAKGHENIAIEMIEPDIEDCFMALMKE